MTWRAHVAVGCNSIWLTMLAGTDSRSIFILLPAAAIASMLPDIDAAGSGAKIHYIGGGVLGGFKNFHGKYFHHRGIMHSLFMAAIFFAVLFLVNIFALQNTLPLLPYVFALSYISHPIIDGFNTGVGYLYPFVLKKYMLIPRFFSSPVKGFADNLFFVIGAFGVLLYFLLLKDALMPVGVI